MKNECIGDLYQMSGVLQSKLGQRFFEGLVAKNQVLQAEAVLLGAALAHGIKLTPQQTQKVEAMLKDFNTSLEELNEPGRPLPNPANDLLWPGR